MENGHLKTNKKQLSFIDFSFLVVFNFRLYEAKIFSVCHVYLIQYDDIHPFLNIRPATQSKDSWIVRGNLEIKIIFRKKRKKKN